LQDIVKIESTGAVGGIIATAIGFSLPMIFFLEPETFSHWMAHPFYFCYMICTICLAGGALGLCIGRLLSKDLIKKYSLPFPVSELTFRVACANNKVGSAKALIWGVASTLGILALRDGIGKWKGLIPRYIPLFPSIFQNDLCLSIRPMLWSIGYVTGLQTLFPLLIGLISKYLILYPINNHSKYLPISLFAPYSDLQVAFAFCSGILLYEIFDAIPGLMGKNFKIMPVLSTLKSKFASIINTIITHKIKKKPDIPLSSKLIIYVEPVISVALTCILLTYFKFSLPAQLALIGFTTIATYQICVISGKIGLVQFGRFSTMVALPMYLLFGLNFVQVTVIYIFFGVCAAVASDLLFDYKTGSLCSITSATMHRYQWLGLLVSALSSGFIFWLLFTHLTIGSPDLLAQRALGKAAIIQTFQFDRYIVTIGFFFALVLKKFKISPAMTFGGILMPNDMTFALVIGGLIAHFTKGKDNQDAKEFFSAGVFSSESIWVFIKIISKIFI
jgi:uncharacterized oligopeptide transporter (OPT) family protein